MKQLRCRDLQAGDILLKFNAGGFSNSLIALAQSATRQANTQVVHAGVLFDNNYIVEASGPGILANDLRVQNLRYGYIAYRARHPRLGAGAATCAKALYDIHGAQKTMPYNLSGTVRSNFGSTGQAQSPGSMDQLMAQVLNGQSHPFFCTQFVVFVYQFTAAQNQVAPDAVFRIDDAKALPSRLASLLAGNPQFQEAGYLMPGER